MLGPPLQALRNTINSKFAYVYPEAGTLAAGVAQGQVGEKDARLWASYHGVGDDAFTAMIDIANVGPGVAEAYNLWRRDKTDEAGFRRAVKRLGLEQEWIDGLVLLKENLLSLSDVANAVQQGHLPNPGILPDVSAGVEVAGGSVEATAPDGQPPSSVPLTQIDLDPIAIAAGLGYALDELQVAANLAGLPPGPESLLSMWNRNVIDEQSVDAGIREGHMKTKWAGAYKRMRWAVLSAQEYAEAQLRQWVTTEQMYAGGALTGHTKDQMDLLYKNRGRTATPHQIWLAAARKVVGPTYPGEPHRTSLTDEEDHILAIRRSNIRPEYGPMLWDIRFNYPPLFQLNRLVQAKAIDADTAAKWASYNLEAPEVVDALHAYWSKPSTAASKAETVTDLLALLDGGKATAADTLAAIEAIGYTPDGAQGKIDTLDARRVTSARNAAIGDLHTAFKKGSLDQTGATKGLTDLHVSPWAVPLIVAAWQAYLDAFPPPAPAAVPPPAV